MRGARRLPPDDESPDRPGRAAARQRRRDRLGGAGGTAGLARGPRGRGRAGLRAAAAARRSLRRAADGALRPDPGARDRADALTVRGEELTFLSDLHLGGGGSTDPFDDDAALVALIDDLAAAARAGAPARRLVLLGDTLDLVVTGASGHGGRAAMTGLRRIAGAHGEVFASLRRGIAAGVRVELVPGNHDAELALPAVREGLLRLVGRVRVRPWLIHVPGLVLAEHGQQHHCLDRFLGLPGLATGAARSLGPRPPAAVYDPLAARRAAGRGRVGHAVALGLAGPRLALRVLRAVGRGDVAGGAEGLSAGGLAELG